MEILACVGIVAIIAVVILLVDPGSKVVVAQWCVCEARAQLAARKAAREARAASKRFDGELTHAINDFVAHGDRDSARETRRTGPSTVSVSQ